MEAKGCVRNELLQHVAVLLIGMTAEESRLLGGGTELFVEREERQLKSLIGNIRAGANQIRNLNETLWLQFYGLIATVGGGEHLDRHKDHAQLPEMLDDYAGILESLLSGVKDSPFANYRAFCKWQLLKYVKETTGQPNYTLVSRLLQTSADFLGADATNGDDEKKGEFSEEAFRKFFGRIPAHLNNEYSLLNDPLGKRLGLAFGPKQS
jgi:hypothetical protein